MNLTIGTKGAGNKSLHHIPAPEYGLNGIIPSLPGDKSIAHRTLILSSLAGGQSYLKNVPDSNVCRTTLACLKNLGVKIIRRKKSELLIKSRGLKGFKPTKAPLNTGNSGTTIRLLAGLLAGQPFSSRLISGSSLKKRPMDRVILPLKKMGALISGAGNDRFPPLSIRGGNLKSITYRLPVPSAQVKSAVLIAGLYARPDTIGARGVTKIIESVPSRDHTERILKIMGAPLKISPGTIALNNTGNFTLKPLNLTIPGDISSAAFLVVAALLVPNSKVIIQNVCLNPGRIAFIKILKRMGGRIKLIHRGNQSGEPVGHIVVTSSRLKAVKIAGSIIPALVDEIPALAVAATQAGGTTIIKNAEELRLKESNRLQTVASELKRLRANIRETADGLIIKGPARLKGAVCYSHNDHRMAMSLAVAGLVASGKTIIKNAGCIKDSFPEFEKMLKSLINYDKELI